MNEIQDLGWRMKEKRIRMGISMRKMAHQIGISPSFVMAIENGKGIPSEKVLLAAAKAYAWDEHELRVVWRKPDALIKEEALRSRTHHRRLVAFLQLARDLDQKKWDELITIAEKIRSAR